MLDFSSVADFKTPPQVVLTQLTDELDAFLFRERTGVKVMEDFRFPWNKVLSSLDMTLENVDRQRVADFLGAQFDEWLQSRPLPARLEPEYARELPKLLHTAMKKAGDKMKVGSLAMYLAAVTQRPIDLETVNHIAEQIRLFVREDIVHYRLEGQLLYRIMDEKKRATGVVVETDEGSAPPPDQQVWRFTKTIRENLAGMTREQFIEAKRQHGGRITFGQLQSYLERITRPAEPAAAEPEPPEPAVPADPNPLRTKILEILRGPGTKSMQDIMIAVGPSVGGEVVTNAQVKWQLQYLRKNDVVANDGGHGPRVQWWIAKPSRRR